MSWSDHELLPTPDPEVRERRIAGALFFATCCSVFLVTLWRWTEGSLFSEPAVMADALLFTTVLMSILLAHEMGHYAVAGLHRFSLSMPWFLPAPFLVGTFGAIIRLRDTPRTRTGLLEMGAAGPLAGLAVIVVAMGWWLLGATPEQPPDDLHLARPALVWVLSGVLTFGPPPEISPRDPVAFAAWLGCLLTAMNLLPFGQLDGGHVAAALFPRESRAIGWGVTALLLAGAVVWPGWGLWIALLHLMGASSAVEVRSPREIPTPRARWISLAAAIAFLLCITPIPTSG